jgi:hypothetical protein
MSELAMRAIPRDLLSFNQMRGFKDFLQEKITQILNDFL